MDLLCPNKPSPKSPCGNGKCRHRLHRGLVQALLQLLEDIVRLQTKELHGPCGQAAIGMPQYTHVWPRLCMLSLTLR